jgi:hypothetical protein
MALSQMKYSAKDEQSLMTELWDPQIADDLEQFVLFTYPWGKEGTPLERFKGPRSWQRDELQRITEHLKYQKQKMEIGLDPEMWRSGTASGRGPGKSALVSWLEHWMMTTRLGSTTIVTANTEPQLKSKTFAEIGKWSTLAINSHWFDRTVLSIRPAEWFKQQIEEQLKIDCGYYYAQGQLWSEETPDAFAGAHNPLGILVVFDEASGIPNSIFEVTEGFFTEPELNRLWCVFSNPRRNSGGFYDLFHTHHQYWNLRHIDSRTVEGTDKALFAKQIAQYGIDSDMVRKEILGQFPKQGDKQFIGNQLVEAAQQRTLEPDLNAALIMGVDIARFGDDQSVIRFRQGRDARSIAPQKYKNRDNMYMANEIARWIDLLHPDAVNIDAGNGTGVIDRLREMKYRVNEIWFGGKADSKEWANKRTEMYADLRDWLGGGCIDDDSHLFSDLTVPDYHYHGKAADAIMLEAKEDLRARGERSPDDGDALALTFAKRVARRDNKLSRASSRSRVAQGVDDPVLS